MKHKSEVKKVGLVHLWNHIRMCVYYGRILPSNNHGQWSGYMPLLLKNLVFVKRVTFILFITFFCFNALIHSHDCLPNTIFYFLLYTCVSLSFWSHYCRFARGAHGPNAFVLPTTIPWCNTHNPYQIKVISEFAHAFLHDGVWMLLILLELEEVRDNLCGHLWVHYLQQVVGHWMSWPCVWGCLGL